MKIAYILCAMLFLAGCSSNNVNNKDSESKDMINTAVEPVKMSESKGRKIKDVENDIKKASGKMGLLPETERKTVETLVPNRSTGNSVNSTSKRPIYDFSKLYVSSARESAVLAERATKDKAVDNLIRDIEKDKKSSASE